MMKYQAHHIIDIWTFPVLDAIDVFAKYYLGPYFGWGGVNFGASASSEFCEFIISQK